MPIRSAPLLRAATARRPVAGAGLGIVLGLAMSIMGLGCGEAASRPERPAPVSPSPSEAAPAEADAACPAKGVAPEVLPRIRPEHTSLDYWLEQTAKIADLDAPILAPPAIADHNAAMIRGGAGALRHDLLAPIDAAAIAEITELVDARLAFLRGKILEGKYVREDGSAPTEDEVKRLQPVGSLPPLRPELRVALQPIQLRCGPRLAGLYTPSLDLAFDRNLCSMLRPQEPVQVLMPWSDELLLVRSGYVLGWIERGAPLSPPLTAAHAAAFVRGPWMIAARDTTLRTDEGAGVRVDFATRVPRGRGGRGALSIADERGIAGATASDPGALVPSDRPLTRRALLTDAFAYLGRAYGWGGYRGGRDCSRFLMDLLAGFGVDLPRHSSDQALAGAVIEVPQGLGEEERLRAIDGAHRRGIVLLHFPGHIMLYLGRDDRGRAMALHSFAEYLVPCPGRAPEMAAGERETLLTVDRVQVSDLELGRGSSRTAFIERITKITVIGRE